MSLYRKYRPQTFGEIIGQPHVSEPLLKQLTTGKISHAYLFSGPRGTGKTSTARIFAKSVNCQKYPDMTFGEPCNKCDNCKAITQGAYLDVLEIDAASNRGIDEIRDLREKISLAPTTGRFKVYIIDEVHMLTSEAFNALLKTLEEPPEHAIFILATTEAHKVPATIQSRTQKYSLNLPSEADRLKVLEKINKSEKFGTSQETLKFLAKTSDTFRDCIVNYEKVASVNPKAETAEVEAILLVRERKGDFDYLKLIRDKKTKEAIIWLNKHDLSGAGDYKLFTEVFFLEPLRDILLIKVGVLTESQAKYAPEEFRQLLELAKIDREKLTSWINIFTNAIAELKDSPIPQLPLELAIIEACDFNEEPVSEVTVEKLRQEEEVRSEKTQEPETALSKEKEGKVKEPIKEKKEKVLEEDVESLRSSWPQILQKVKPHNNSVEIFLRKATPISVESGLITLEVGYGFHRDMLAETKNNEILERVFSEILGKPVRIKVVVGEKKPQSKVTGNPLDEADPVEVFGKLV
ncbi:MAG TPA: DNA polymerase III subunit gamma/tau [Candidatus Nanoarchaeia archaeon]|nr:DNA polymerase III subunit gamma/tau [uncultured archaeon]